MQFPPRISYYIATLMYTVISEFAAFWWNYGKIWAGMKGDWYVRMCIQLHHKLVKLGFCLKLACPTQERSR